MKISKIKFTLMQIIEWQRRFFLREYNVAFCCDCIKMDFEKKIYKLYSENRFKKNLSFFRNNFVININGNEILINREKNICGFGVYQLSGQLIDKKGKTYIIGRYQMTPFNRFFSLVWINFFSLFCIVIFLFLLKDGFVSLIIEDRLTLVINDMVILLFSLGAFLFGLIVLRIIGLLYSIKTLSSFLFKIGIVREDSVVG